MKHSQEPWQGECLAIYAEINGRKTMIGQLGCSCDAGVSAETCEENVKRIVACVNACIGLPTDMLEGASAVDGVVSSIIEVSNQRADDIKRLKAQLDDLVNALALEGQYWATVEEGGFQAGAEFLKSKGHSGKTSPNDFFEQKKHAALEKIVATHG
jgi:hypothetical protein